LLEDLEDLWDVGEVPGAQLSQNIELRLGERIRDLVFLHLNCHFAVLLRVKSRVDHAFLLAETNLTEWSLADDLRLSETGVLFYPAFHVFECYSRNRKESINY